MKTLLRLLFVLFCSFWGAFIMFKLNAEAPITGFTQLFNSFDDTSKMPENYTLQKVNLELLPNLRWSAIWGTFGGFIYGFFIVLFGISFSKRKQVAKQA